MPGRVQAEAHQTQQTHRRRNRTALYARVSTSEQGHALQIDELRQIAQQRGYETVEYVDTASGSGTKMTERARLLSDARLGKVDCVVVWRFDRFARSTRDLLDALDNFRQWGVEFISLREGVDTSTPTGKLVFTVIAALAEFERELIRERVRAGLAAARRRGARVGRPRRQFDLDRALKLIAAGAGVKRTARTLGLSPRTLRRALGRGQKPADPRGVEDREKASPGRDDNSGGET